MDELMTVGEVSALAGVTVRALHHYDAVGLLVPSARSESGYRLYTRSDLERLQEIGVARTLGFSLDQIRSQLDDPHHDRLTALRRQRALLQERLEDLGAMLDTIDRTLAAIEGGTTMAPRDLFEGFDPAAHEAEAIERWGSTPAYGIAKRRTGAYSPEQWRTIQDEAADIARRLAECRGAGFQPASAEAARHVEEHRRHIDRWYFPCTPEMHQGLCEMYVADARFGSWWDRFAPGLATYVLAARLATPG